jgi:hypothetical protein
MLKLKSKFTTLELKPTIEMLGTQPKDGEKDTRTPVYGDPFGFTLEIAPLKTPDMIRLQAMLDSSKNLSRNEAAYNEMEGVLSKSLGGWDGFTKEKMEEIVNGEVEDIPATHAIYSPSLRVNAENKSQAIDALLLLCENNIGFYGALSSGILELSMQKKRKSISNG